MTGKQKFKKRLKRQKQLNAMTVHKVIDCRKVEKPKPLSITDIVHPRCYANVLGGCTSTISQEHYISKNILEKFGDIDTGGVPWINSGKKLKASSLFVSNCLCTVHNSYLSDLDSFAGKFFGYLEIFHTIQNRTLVFDGTMLERWMLKILIGLVSTGQVAGSTTGSISKSWYEYLFELSPFPSDIGLFCHFQVGQKIEVERKISITTLCLDSKLEGLKLELCGFTFWLSMVPAEIAFKQGAQNQLIHRLAMAKHLGNKTNLQLTW